MTDPIARPGNADPAIDHATEQVIDAWQGATPGKEPDATTGDFERMREGFGDLGRRSGDNADDGGVTESGFGEDPGTAA